MHIIAWACIILFICAFITGDPVTILFFGGLLLVSLATLPSNDERYM